MAEDADISLKVMSENQQYVSLMAPLVRFFMKTDLMSFSQCGEFGQKFLDDYAAFKKTFKLGQSIVSPGFGYDEQSVQAMKKVGFYTGPAVAAVLNNIGPVWGKRESGQTELINHPLSELKERFEEMGIQCFLVSGGVWPGESDSSALVFDITDPDFLQKLKPHFLNVLAEEEAWQLMHPNNMRTPELMRAYSYHVAAQLRQFGKEIDAVYPDHAGNSGVSPSNIVQANDQAARQAEYHMEFFTDAFRPMLSLLSPQERGAVILEIVGRLSGSVSSQHNNNLHSDVNFAPLDMN